MLASMKPITKTRPRTVAKASREDEARWRAVMSRDVSADGTFWYSVATTGVYCRPSCGARRPLRSNVRFHKTCGDAEAAGYRACKRCKPHLSPSGQLHADRIAAACRQIETAETAPCLGDLARHVGLSPYHFHRLFKATTGVTPKAYATAHRAEKVRAELKNGASVTGAIYAAGFGSSARFYDTADRALGMKPCEYRSGGRNMQIRYAIAPCSLGLVLAGATGKGICAIFLGDDAAALVDDLRKRFPQASLVEGDAEFAKLLAEVVSGIETPGKAAALPIDIVGTAFQQQVWAALRDIAPGETATYADIAKRIGKPNAVRAVGTACGANPIAVAIPCHRVVGSDGKLTGYRWGIGRKRALLDREQK
jgi:AraC family transcriptional regulator, regulatory protein of adaptative response / methylated-DNA-[protein]-cysteine methyltransferase